MSVDHYVIRGGVEGRERLRLLGRVLGPTTIELLERAGLRAGMACLDVGCGGGDVAIEIGRIVGRQGRVVGWDIDEIELDLARRDARTADMTQVEFRAIDIRQARFANRHEPAADRSNVGPPAVSR